MSDGSQHKLSPTGLTPTEKFWVSHGGEVIPLRGLWHYQWALGHVDDHAVDLGGETEEQPVRLRMLAGGWRRMNYDRKTCVLTVEGDIGSVNENVRGAVVGFVEENARALNRVRVNLLDGMALASSLVVDMAGEDAGHVRDAMESFLGT